MAEQSTPKGKKKAPSDAEILLFIIILCFACGFLLATVSYGLSGRQKETREFERNRQMLISANILTHNNRFQIAEKDGSFALASFDDQKQILVPTSKGEVTPRATDDQIRLLSQLRIRPLLTDDSGALFTFEEKQIDLPQYLIKNKKQGYAKLPLRLLYAILPNDAESAKITAEALAKDISKAEAFVFPVSGYGLWGPIFGYLALRSDGNTVISTTWYESAETPGLGANITAPWWQANFLNRLLFHQSNDGKTDFKTATMGIVVVKGRVQDVYGNSPKAKSAVDGISGSTLTGDGVTAAYQNSMTPYRPFFLKLRAAQESKGKENKTTEGAKEKAS